MEYDGDMWYQLWDMEQNLPYWYCEETGKSQWATPGEDDEAASNGAMTDYSTDHYSSGGEYTDSEYDGGQQWQEYWDEQAQAKYWYNNVTVRSWLIFISTLVLSFVNKRSNEITFVVY